jgi:hypothetical protein
MCPDFGGNRFHQFKEIDMRYLSNKSTRNFGAASFRNHFDGTFPDLVFIASCFLYVGGSIAMLLSNNATVV